MAQKEKENKPIIATARFKDFAAYREWWLSEDRDFEWMANFMDSTENIPGAHAYMPFMTRFFRDNNCFTYSSKEAKENAKREKVERTRNTDIAPHLKKLEAMVQYAEAFDQSLNINYLTDTGAYIYLGNPDSGFFIIDPYKYLDIEMVPDYTNLSVAEVRSLTGRGTSATGPSYTLPANVDGGLSVAEARSSLKNLRDNVSRLEQQRDKVNRCETEELAEMKAKIQRMEQEMYEKKQALMDQLNIMKEELAEKVDLMERQIYLLESEIYAIRCYMGDTIRFAKVRSGANAPDTEPVILHQKLRFLDEDLGRLISLYSLDWNDRKTFEDFLAHSPVALENFAPNERCVTLVRLSRTGHHYAPHEKIKNALDIYETYHGRAVGVIIRNGENLYMGWTDDEKVHIQDDFVMDMKPRVVAEEAYAKAEETEREYKDRLKREQAQATMIMDGIISRVFIFNILQGIVDNSSILPLPKGVKISRQSEYVQFSLADLWLTSNRFGSFSDIVERCNSRISVGDFVLSTQNLRGGKDYSFSSYRGPDTWHNDRGRGDRNRMRDCEVTDCTIYPINLIEQDDPIPMVRYRYPNPLKFPGDPDWYETTTEDRHLDRLAKGSEILEHFERIDTHYYVSVKKEWSQYDARSNFEIYPGEILNLTYMNSVWLEYAISNKKLGGWMVGGKLVDYAYAIRYLNTALEFIRKREAGEKTFLDALDPEYTKNNPEWPLALSEWKLAKGVRNITEYQAKRFLKYISSKEQIHN